ncbi:MAG: hypothetical protein IKM13_02795 [Clostridia bacterium]|nr:hypothetical protein [Clostridia bacterium]
MDRDNQTKKKEKPLCRMDKKYNRKPSLCHLRQDEKDWYNEVGGDGSPKAQQKKGA